jgi:DNA-directed RNA polymerase specialized sigma24 family protein
MTISEYTQRIDHLKWMIESKKEKILALEEIATSITSVQTGMPHDPSPVQSRMAEAVLKKLDLENSIKEDEAAIKALKEELGTAIDRVTSPKYQTILYKRYIRSMSTDEIRADIAYSERSTQRLIGEATRALEEVLSTA